MHSAFLKTFAQYMLLYLERLIEHVDGGGSLLQRLAPSSHLMMRLSCPSLVYVANSCFQSSWKYLLYSMSCFDHGVDLIWQRKLWAPDWY
jgi:hypothetical protein